jgi:hypothetical protein
VFRVWRVGYDGLGDCVKAFTVGKEGWSGNFGVRYLETVFIEGGRIEGEDGVKGVQALHKGRILVTVFVRVDRLLGRDSAEFRVTGALSFAVTFDVIEMRRCN